MLTIRESVAVGYDETSQKNINRVHLDVDTASDLPTSTGIDGMVLAQGSTAWVISTGDCYGLKSDGTWVKQ